MRTSCVWSPNSANLLIPAYGVDNKSDIDYGRSIEDCEEKREMN